PIWQRWSPGFWRRHEPNDGRQHGDEYNDGGSWTWHGNDRDGHGRIWPGHGRHGRSSNDDGRGGYGRNGKRKCAGRGHGGNIDDPEHAQGTSRHRSTVGARRPRRSWPSTVCGRSTSVPPLRPLILCVIPRAWIDPSNSILRSLFKFSGSLSIIFVRY